jgi:hypothetical protein
LHWLCPPGAQSITISERKFQSSLINKLFIPKERI